MPRILAVAPVLPRLSAPQSEITEALIPILSPDADRAQVIRRIHAATGVERRHIAIPLHEYATLGSFDAANAVYQREGTELGVEAVERALQVAGVRADEVDLFLFTTVTGVSAPSLDAAIIDRVGMPRTVRRWPSFGLGCVAGASGIARLDDYLVGHPHAVAVLLAVELCSLTLQGDDHSMANVVASGLFGDGAAAVVMVGDARAAQSGTAGYEVVGTRSALYPHTESALGWNVGSSGFRIVLGAGVPGVVHDHAGDDVRHLLAEHDVLLGSVDSWAVHPGGPKVLDAFAEALALPDGSLDRSWNVMARSGNLSSAAVLHVLADVVDAAPAEHSTAVVFAVGPGVTAETVLLRWVA